jgi:hydrogenase maturation protease
MKFTPAGDLIRRLENTVKNKKVVVLFVGNPIRGDDGAPQLLLRTLKGRVMRLRMFNCGTSPQDCIDQVAELQPDAVIFVNAVERSLRPGTVILEQLRSNSLTGSSLIGHKFPLALMASLLTIMGRQRNAIVKTYLVGIQVGSTRGRITAPVREAVKRLLDIFMRVDHMARAFAAGEGAA